MLQVKSEGMRLCPALCERAVLLRDTGWDAQAGVHDAAIPNMHPSSGMQQASAGRGKAVQPTCRQMVSLQLKPLSSRSGFTPGQRDRQAEGAP